MHTAYIGLGSNLGSSLEILRAAWHELGTRPQIQLRALSSPYRSEPVGMVSAHWFVNAAGWLETTLPPEELLALLLAIEGKFGRVRHPEVVGYHDRTLDLDLLFFDTLIKHEPALLLPHPRLAERLFVLLPLVEIAPHLIHPLLQRPLAELLAELRTRSSQPRIERISWTAGRQKNCLRRN